MFWNVHLLTTDLDHREVILYSWQDVKFQILTSSDGGHFLCLPVLNCQPVWNLLEHCFWRVEIHVRLFCLLLSHICLYMYNNYKVIHETTWLWYFCKILQLSLYKIYLTRPFLGRGLIKPSALNLYANIDQEIIYLTWFKNTFQQQKKQQPRNRGFDKPEILFKQNKNKVSEIFYLSCCFSNN